MNSVPLLVDVYVTVSLPDVVQPRARYASVVGAAPNWMYGSTSLVEVVRITMRLFAGIASWNSFISPCATEPVAFKCANVVGGGCGGVVPPPSVYLIVSAYGDDAA